MRRQQTLPGFAANDVDGAVGAAGAGPPDLRDAVVYVVDAHALIYQVFHALPEMTSPSGQPVGAIHGFVRDMLELIDRKQASYLFCAFDMPSGVTFRHQIYDQYKATREPMPEDLRPQIGNIQRLLAALGIPIVQLEGYEADDVLATIAQQTEAAGGNCLLVTSDKDCRQLLSDRTKIYNIRKDQLYGAQALLEDWGVRPDQVVDFQSLVGDSVDNVPGVPLIGPKLARELLQKYETLDQVLDHADEVSGKKRRENLLTYREQALLSRRLVRLSSDVPVVVDWVAGRVGGIDREQVAELCHEFGFRRLAEQLGGLSAAAAPAVWETDYQLIDSDQKLLALGQRLRSAARIALKTETTSANPRWAEPVGLAFSWDATQAAYIPLRAPADEPQLSAETVFTVLREVLENPAIEKVGHNLKFDLIVLRGVGISLAGISFDTMVADYLLEAGQRNHGLGELASRYLNHTTESLDKLLGSGRKQKRVDAVPAADIGRYAAEAADVSLRLATLLEERLAEQGLEELFHSLEMPLTEVLAELEFNGIRVDAARLQELGSRLAEQLARLEAEIHQLAGGAFNIESPRQLAKILFEQLQLPVSKRTKTGPSTDAQVLAELAGQHPLPAKIIEYRQSAKLKSTYVDALPQLVHPQTGRVHSSFKQDVAATGRLSSTEPNLQNIPVRTAEGRRIRSAFLPAAGWQLLAADYSQIELRVLAHYSGDPALCRAFAEDQDIHALVASEVHQVSIRDVTAEMRHSAKAVNFGVIYGQSPFGLGQALEIPKDEAAQFIDSYFSRYRRVENFIQKVLEECRQNGYVSTILGRRRAVQGIRDPSRVNHSRLRNLPERIAINTVIQGSAADLIKQAMINVSQRLKQEQLKAQMLLQIHDELVFEFPSEELTTLIPLVKEEMVSVGHLLVPLKVDAKVGENWAECEAVP